MAKLKRKVSKLKSKMVVLPVPKPKQSAPAVKLQFNQSVTLRSDRSFLGHVFAKMPDGTEYMISIKNPGNTGKRGCKFFPARDVIPAEVSS